MTPEEIASCLQVSAEDYEEYDARWGVQKGPMTMRDKITAAVGAALVLVVSAVSLNVACSMQTYDYQIARGTVILAQGEALFEEVVEIVGTVIAEERMFSPAEVQRLKDIYAQGKALWAELKAIAEELGDALTDDVRQARATIEALLKIVEKVQ